MTQQLEPDGPAAERTGRIFVAAAVLAVGLFVAYLVAGMPGMDHEASGVDETMPSMDHGSMAYASLPPDDFAARMAQGAFVVNVHRPYEGEIAGTSAFIEFDQILGDRRLPSDTDAPILLYCQTGRMSEIAAEELVGAGYTDVAHLEGGMEAWEADGKSLRRSGSSADG